MKYILIALTLIASLAAQTKPTVETKPASVAPKAAPAPAPKYEMTELESLKLQVLQKDIQLQNSQMQQLQNQASQVQQQQQTTVQDLQKQMEEIRKAHGWGKDIEYNFQTGAWAKQAPAADKK